MSNSGLIVNANAPIVDINIKVNFQYSPENIQMNCSQNMPGVVVCRVLLTCTMQLLGLMMQSEAQNAKPAAVPDLPPAPKSN